MVTFQINGNLTNTGNDITLFVDEDLIPHLNVSGGPLQYNYHLHQMKLHFGEDEQRGSEHTINGLSFPAEVQTYIACFFEAMLIQIIIYRK